jgi:hypothetical protein
MEKEVCRFDSKVCLPSCKKYSICSYYSIQNQLTSIQSQLNFIYKTITDILESSKEAEVKVSLLEGAMYKISCDVLKDSETTILNNKESHHEKENE